MILGGGAAAFAAITEASSCGLSTAMVNTGLPLGGTCVNVGFVPSKHLLAVSETAYEPPNNPFDAVQYSSDEPTIDWSAALDEKDRLVGQLRQENYVDVAEHFGTDIYEGYGTFVDSTTIEVVDGPAAGTRITGEKALIATGSSPWAAPIDGLDDVETLDSTDTLFLDSVPDSLVVVGGGYVGCEYAQMYSRFGADVTVIQRPDRLLPERSQMSVRSSRTSSPMRTSTFLQTRPSQRSRQQVTRSVSRQMALTERSK